MKTIICGSTETVKVLSMAEKKIPLENVIQIEEVSERDRELAKSAVCFSRLIFILECQSL